MPRRVNPGDIRVGPGHRAHDESAEASLTGPGMSGPGPNIGEADVETSSPPLPGGGAAVDAHTGSHKAHKASDIVTEGNPPTLPVDNVQEAIDDLAGAIPPEPPTVGNETSHLEFTGIPDWGVMKLNDSNLVDRHGFVPTLSTPNDPAYIFPYYWVAAGPALDDPEFDSTFGADPPTDMTFNSGLNPATLAGAGPGDAFAGGFTRPGTGVGPDPVIKTLQILERGGSARQVVFSGSLYPADRGVLALLHWPSNPTDVSDFLAQPLLDRCVCALLLGQGILGEGPCVEGACDGEPGGIFDMGEDADGEYNPFEFPGQATGQYNLSEIVSGVDDLYLKPLRAPWDAGWVRDQNSTDPGPGQVRLGTDPFADKGTGNAPVQPYGIPILGARTAAYNPAPGATLGKTVLDSANFFRYRLPYLNDYSVSSGIKYTPGGVPGTETSAQEKARYFYPSPPAALPLGATYLEQAGDFPDFPEDYYPWQLARYRQVINLEYIAGPGLPDDLGSYILIHFKTEVDFESYVRDGVLPDDATDGYEVYSAYLVTGPDAAIEDPGNRANEDTSDPVPPLGPAPTYGYSAESYHVVRSVVLEDPDDHAVAPGEVSASCELDVDISPDVMWVSGVAYYIPRDQGTGVSQARLLNMDATVSNFWDYSYRTSDYPLSGDPPTDPPALLSTPCPAFIGLAPFAFQGGSFTAPVGAAGAAFVPSLYSVRTQRLEIPFTHLNGVSSWSDTQGPPHGTPAEIRGSIYGAITLDGDDLLPSFSIDPQTRLYLRRPLGHRNINTSAQPFVAADGHGSLFVRTGDTVLYHSTSFDPGGLNGKFGNFAPATPGPAFAVLESEDKDAHERFLDEVYRYAIFPVAIDSLPQYGPGAAGALNGPGMGGWVGGPIETPIRIGTVASVNWDQASFIQQGFHTALVGLRWLQVSGLPDRNPPLSDGNIYPFPSSGVLVYPSKDFSSGYRPTAAEAGAPQPNYIGSLGNRRSHIRVFDASLDGDVDAVGSPFVLLRIDGIELQDFHYVAPGPGAYPKTGIAIFIKVPGLTTWMDLGRVDGGGPSKQDALLDGAGCKVICPETLDGVDPETGMVFCQVKANVGPLASLFLTQGIDGADRNKVPVLVKVQMNPTAIPFNLEEEYDSSTQTFSGIAETGVSAEDVRGIVGIRIVDPTEPFDPFGNLLVQP